MSWFRRKPVKIYPKPNAPCGGRMFLTESGLCADCEDCGERWIRDDVIENGGRCMTPCWQLQKRSRVPFIVVIEDMGDLS